MEIIRARLAVGYPDDGFLAVLHEIENVQKG
jgi:hypothetical protein